MENLRRPSDRSISKEPGLKKPRLTEVTPASDRSSNGRRGFIQRPAATNSGAGVLSFQRDRDSESSDSVRGTFPQQPGQQLHHELVTQYKTALAELTFNSKPIITNLTIIAGENLHAAKAIAATICANILEVPSEQKLPSLYLLDSIVKNIGRDYIKSFSTRLPEVFCKAYRQVDPSIHQSMRHLFGTWKGVFSPQSLHLIEKELGFTSTVNVSSQGSIASRQDSQPQHPTPSIHVNPKYLEARQKLEITRARGSSDDDNGATVKSIDDVRAPERTSTINSGRSWAGPYAKSINHQHKDLINESGHDKNSGAAHVHYDYGSNILGRASLGTGRVSETAKEQGFDRPRYDFGFDVAGKLSQQNNGFDPNHGFEPSNSGSHLQHNKNFASRNIDGMNKSWKNLEEEEYMWDEINSKPSDFDAAGTFVKYPRVPENYGGLDAASRLGRSQGAHDIEPRIDDKTSAEGRVLSGPVKSTTHVGTPGYGAKFSSIPQGQTLGAASSLKPKFVNQHPPSSSFSASEYKQTSSGPPTDPRKPAGLRNIESNHQNSPDSLHLPYRDVNQPNKQRLHPQTTSAVNPLQKRKHVPTTQLKNNKVSSFEPSSGENIFVSQVSASESHSAIVTSPSDKSNRQAGDSPGPGQSITSSLLAAVVQSGILNNSTVTGRSSMPIQETGQDSSLGDLQPALPSDPHTGFPLSRPPGKLNQPPLRSSSPSSLAGIQAEKPPTGVKAASDPVSSLLSSLVAKGLISSKSDSLSFTSPKMPNQSLDRGPEVASPSCTPVPSIPGIMDKPLSSITDKPSSLKSAAEVCDDMPQSETKIKNLIGFEFRPDIVRSFNPAVVSELSGLPHQCSICGIGLKCQEQLDRHMDWHVVKDSEQNSSNINSRRWYTDSDDWVAGIGCFHDSDSATDLLGGLRETSESDDHMVPADENQCACILCGQLFDDFYSLGRDEWMFRGAVYLTKPSSESFENTGTASGNTFPGPIVHANCISDQVVHDFGLACHIKLLLKFRSIDGRTVKTINSLSGYSCISCSPFPLKLQNASEGLSRVEQFYISSKWRLITMLQFVLMWYYHTSYVPE
ncbi:pre-mRNA cleavage complex 2 protein Pcf11-like [Dorcoceras hygrometricum]|uniref:Pre-mRNA cleavage complex 2 protein Pcf11-like n=1 Tax=Dorcoceras hygrometricum TaxID=472368 RepID=A0A2Z7A078_9LAMI|nr:pre-mRNA cleavage complex 2 protein Pcf11-like [Dorcoceras hygrometricum]